MSLSLGDAYALPYSQGQMTPVTTMRRTQKMPHGTMPRVAVGQIVKATEIIAVAEVPEERRLIDLGKALKVPSSEAERYVLKRQGDPVSKGEVLASRTGLLGLRKRRALSPFEGRIAWIGDGQMLLEGGRKRIEILAPAPGRITAIEEGEYVTIETHGAAIEVAWGYGGLAWGTLKVMDTTPSYNTETGRFNIDHRGSIVAIASPLTEAFVKEAADIRVKGIIAASMHASLIPMLEKVEFPVGLTQGFGQLPMSERVLGILNTHNGREIALDMTDSRGTPPEIIIPIATVTKPEGQTPEPSEHSLRAGQRVRILQSPFLGEIGTVAEILPDPRQLPSGLWLPGAMVEVGMNKTIFVPFANLQHLG